MTVKYIVYKKNLCKRRELTRETLTGILMAYLHLIHPFHSPAIRNIMAWSGVSSFMFFFFFRDFPGMSANRTLWPGESKAWARMAGCGKKITKKIRNI